jgi:diguanylate cyclase (GGDEF)-like protein
MNQSLRSGEFFSLTMLDIDNFKLYNDTYGHCAGDKVIISVADTMRSVYQRKSDYNFRVGGEEFIVITIDKSADDAFANAERLRDAIERLNIEHLKNSDFKRVTVSVGVISVRVDRAISWQMSNYTTQKRVEEIE